MRSEGVGDLKEYICYHELYFVTTTREYLCPSKTMLLYVQKDLHDDSLQHTLGNWFVDFGSTSQQDTNVIQRSEPVMKLLIKFYLF